MLIISIKFGERSEGADEILIWIPQLSVAIGSTIFFICVIIHNFILLILKKSEYIKYVGIIFNSFFHINSIIIFWDQEFG